VLAWTEASNEPGVRFAVCWLVPTWLMFEILPTKLIHYELPAYGALAMLMAAAVREPLGKLVRRIGAGLSVFAGLLAAVAVYGQKEFGTGGDLAWTILAAGCWPWRPASPARCCCCAITRPAPWSPPAYWGSAAHIALTAGLIPHLEPLFLSKDVADALDRTSCRRVRARPAPWPSPAIPSPA
jgi:4-amino-4-deoxy-L-arabinose transferase-like glycosyltransferase